MKWKTSLLFVPLLLFVLCCCVNCYQVSGITLDSSSPAFEVGNENYTVNNEMSFDDIMWSSSWIRFDDIDFNITSSNDINITLYSINSNPSATSVNELVLRFSAETTSGTVYFNISGLETNQSYDVYRDDVLMSSLTSNNAGSLNFTSAVWSSHDFKIYEDDQYIKITYTRSDIEDVTAGSYDVIQLIGIIGLVVVAAVIVGLIMKFGSVSNKGGF